jgi:hypothetical protein
MDTFIDFESVKKLVKWLNTSLPELVRAKASESGLDVDSDNHLITISEWGAYSVEGLGVGWKEVAVFESGELIGTLPITPEKGFRGIAVAFGVERFVVTIWHAPSHFDPSARGPYLIVGTVPDALQELIQT